MLRTKAKVEMHCKLKRSHTVWCSRSLQEAHLIDAAVSSSSNQHIMLCSSTTAFGNNKSEAADQMAAYRLLPPSQWLLPALHTIQLLRRPMQLIAAFRVCAHRSDTNADVDHCAGATFATHQGNLGGLPSFPLRQQY